jgi:hypothetical protein
MNFPARLDPPPRWRLARFIRLWQFTWLPWLGLLSVAAAGLLAFTRFWPFLFLSLGLFFLSAVLHVSSLSSSYDNKPGIIGLSLATFRFSLLTLISLLSLNRAPSLLGAVGGKVERYDQSPAA